MRSNVTKSTGLLSVEVRPRSSSQVAHEPISHHSAWTQLLHPHRHVFPKQLLQKCRSSVPPRCRPTSQHLRRSVGLAQHPYRGFQQLSSHFQCPDRNHLPIFASLGQPQSFLCCPAEKSTLSNVSRLYVSPIVTSHGPEIPTSSRNKVTGCTAVQEHLGRPLEPPSASEPASTPLACCTPWSGDPNDHTDGHRIIPCPWNRFHLCEVPMNRNHRIKLIPS
eukprot:g15454.t1